MPLGLNRNGDFRNGSPITLPHNFGNPVNTPVDFGNDVTLPLNVGNPVTWLPNPAHFGNIIGPTTTPLAAPVAAPAGGSYTSAQSVTLTTDPNATATYYTTDGSTPTTSSTLYSGPITTTGSGTEVIKAFSHGTGLYSDSPVMTATYVITPPIAFVGQASIRNGELAGLNSNLVLNYASTAGNTLLVFVEVDQTANAAINSVTDNNGHVWTNLVIASASGNVNGYSVYVLENAAAITSVTIQFAGVASSVISVFAGVSEYSGVASLGTQNFYLIPNFSNVGGTTPPYTQTAVLNSGGNWLVTSFSIGSTSAANPTSVAGHLRFGFAYDIVSGHATTNGTAVTYVSGAHFVTDGSWTGKHIVINSLTFTISIVNSATSLTLTTSAGVLTNQPYTFNAYGGAVVALSDNTAATATSVVNTVSIVPTANWGAFGIELIAGGNPVPPQVNLSSANSGPAAGGTPITLTGVGFVNGATIAIVDEVTGTPVPATSVVFVSSVEMTCVTPAGTSGDLCDIVVTNPNGTFGGIGNGFWSYV